MHDPQSIYAFEEHEVIIPAVVLEEIDSKKRNADEIGRNARTVSRLLDGLREQGHLHDGVLLENGGTLKVELNHRAFVKVQELFSEASNDNRILAVALNYKLEEEPKEDGRPVVLVSKDVLVRIKADVLGLTTQDYLSDRTADPSELYPGFSTLKVHPSVIDEFYSYRYLPIKPLQLSYPLYPHEFVILKDEMGTGKSALLHVNEDATRLEPLHLSNEPVWGISARNAQQRMAIELLLNDDIPLVTITGKAGTGKPCWHWRQAYPRWRMSINTKTAHCASGRSDGEGYRLFAWRKEEKLRPWMRPIYDNLEYLFDTKNRVISIKY